MSLRIHSGCGKMRTRINPNADNFLRSDSPSLNHTYENQCREHINYMLIFFYFEKLINLCKL